MPIGRRCTATERLRRFRSCERSSRLAIVARAKSIACQCSHHPSDRSEALNTVQSPKSAGGFYFNRHADVACHLSSATFARVAPVQNSPNTFVARNVALSPVEMAESDGVSAGQREELQSARAPATLILCCSFIIVKQRNLVGLVLINLFKKRSRDLGVTRVLAICARSPSTVSSADLRLNRQFCRRIRS